MKRKNPEQEVTSSQNNVKLEDTGMEEENAVDGAKDMQDESIIVPPEIRENILKLANMAFRLFSMNEAFHPVESDPNIWEYHAGCKKWTDEEQATFDRITESFKEDSSLSTLKQASMIAAEIPDKTIRDVVARMTVLKDTTPQAATQAAAATAATVIHLGGSMFDGGTDPRSLDPDIERDAVGASDWKDPSSDVSHALNSARTTMPISFGAPASKFPYELQVSQLLQENLILIGRLRENLLGVKLAKNIALMRKFEDNISAIFTMIRALPVMIPPLPITLKRLSSSNETSSMISSSSSPSTNKGAAAMDTSVVGDHSQIRCDPPVAVDGGGGSMAIKMEPLSGGGGSSHGLSSSTPV